MKGFYGALAVFRICEIKAPPADLSFCYRPTKNSPGLRPWKNICLSAFLVKKVGEWVGLTIFGEMEEWWRFNAKPLRSGMIGGGLTSNFREMDGWWWANVKTLRLHIPIRTYFFVRAPHFEDCGVTVYSAFQMGIVRINGFRCTPVEFLCGLKVPSASQMDIVRINGYLPRSQEFQG